MPLRVFDDAKYVSPASDAELSDLEAAFGVPLPDALRAFLSMSNGAFFMQSAHSFIARFGAGDSHVMLNEIFSTTDAAAHNRIWHSPHTWQSPNDETMLPKELVVFGDAVDDTDVGPLLFDLRPNAPRPGAIYFRHLTYRSDDPDPLQPCGFVADSFEEFLNILQDL